MKHQQKCRMCGSPGLRTVGGSPRAVMECEECGFISVAGNPPISSGSAASRHGESKPVPWPDDLRIIEPAANRLETGRQHSILTFGHGGSRLDELFHAQGDDIVAVDVAAPPSSTSVSRLISGIDAGRFDLVCFYRLFEYLSLPRPVVMQMLRLPRPGGLVLIHTDLRGRKEVPDVVEDGPSGGRSYYCRQSFEKVLEGEHAEVVWSDQWTVLIEIGDRER